MSDSQRRSTAFLLVTQLMRSMGMSIPTTVAGSTDKRSQQFFQIANDAGQQLAQDPYKWQQLLVEHTINTVPGTATYALPADFDGYFNESMWNRTTRLPLAGALNEQGWQLLKARLSSGQSWTAKFRVINDKVEFFNTPTAVETLVLPYTSRGWVADQTDSHRKDNIENDADVVMYDPQLFKAKMKLLWYSLKQFDTTKVQIEYNRAYASAKANNKPGESVSLAGTGLGFPYLTNANVPDSGIGL
jgi:hypothetical protein